MTEQFMAFLDFKDAQGGLVRVHLKHRLKVLVLLTKVAKCNLVSKQDVLVFQEGEKMTVRTPECGDCPAAVQNRKSSTTPLCHIYQNNQSSLP